MNIRRVEKTKRFLFATPAEMKEGGLSEQEIRGVIRIREVYEYMRDHPVTPESLVVKEFLTRFSDLKPAAVYDTVAAAKVCIGTICATNRDFIRWKFNALCEEGLMRAREKGDVGAFARILSVISKAARLDSPDGEAPDYSQIQPEAFLITADPADAGYTVEPGFEKRRAALLSKYRLEIEEADAKPIE